MSEAAPPPPCAAGAYSSGVGMSNASACQNLPAPSR